MTYHLSVSVRILSKIVKPDLLPQPLVGTLASFFFKNYLQNERGNLMRQLTTNEVTAISGGNEALVFLGIVGFTAFTIGLLASIPPRPCTQVTTPVYQNGIYVGDMVDTYCY
jgi:hypothetical protein